MSPPPRRGNGPGTIRLAQDVGLIAPGDALTFDYRAGWLLNFAEPGDLDRTFEVFIEPAGGGAPLNTFPVLTAQVGTNTFGGPNSDTGPLSRMIDLSPFAGPNARVDFVWTVPNNYTGPANAQLDNVRITPEPAAAITQGLALPGILALARRLGARPTPRSDGRPTSASGA